jgi:hypothetical protein
MQWVFTEQPRRHRRSRHQRFTFHFSPYDSPPPLSTLKAALAIPDLDVEFDDLLTTGLTALSANITTSPPPNRQSAINSSSPSNNQSRRSRRRQSAPTCAALKFEIAAIYNPDATHARKSHTREPQPSALFAIPTQSGHIYLGKRDSNPRHVGNPSKYRPERRPHLRHSRLRPLDAAA